IVGFMGCGKTAVAQLLAALLNRKVIDLDELITRQQERTPAEIINEDGEAAFRSTETAALRELLDGGFDGVLSIGGGGWIESANRQLLGESKAITVWLDAPFDVCWERIESGQEIRPMAPTRDKAKALFEGRQPVYQTAMTRVATRSGESLESLVSRVAAAVRAIQYRLP
ncbi:MAG TPA: shikimate kinase, partial [Pyrinomonadaceae bacterium]|nr:shikimate kinase [Pyrinomonadaceae bacterium]